MGDETSDTLLDDKLAAAAPEVTPGSEELQNRLRTMISAAELQAQVKPRRVRAIVSGALAAVIILGGANALPGVRDTFQQSSGTHIPLLTYGYTLPSGIACDATFGVESVAQDDAVEAIRDFGRSSILISDSDVQPVIANMRASSDTFITEAGIEEPWGYGKKHYYTVDEEYQAAVTTAIEDLVRDELAHRGLSADALGPNSWQELRCPGKTW